LKNILLFLLFTIVISCENSKNIIHKSTDGSIKELNNWFAQDANFQKDKDKYNQKFNKAFIEALRVKDYKKSSDLLLSVFQVMSNNGNFDDDYIKLLNNYLKKYNSKIFIDDLFTFFVYLGAYESLNLNHQKCIDILKNVIKLEAYNYRTYTEKSYAYYYISYSYFNIGELDKALEENQNAILCFNQTDNYYGQALVNHNKATICYNSKNEQEAIKSINKVIYIYKKIKYYEGLIPAMINKYEFSRSFDEKKANPYLDTIGNYIKKGLIKDEQTILHYNILMLNKFIKEKNIKELDKLIPKVELQVKKINVQYWEYMAEIDKSQYQLLKYNKILNRDKLLTILESYKKNEEISYTNFILNILKDEAIANNDLKKVLEYDNEIDEYEKKIQEKNIQFKVKTFEKKINNAKKEKIIALQKTQISKNKSYVLILIMILIILTLATILYFARKRKLEAKAEIIRQEQFTFQLLQNTEEERNRIAGELHDSVNHELLNIKNNLINGKTIIAEDVSHVIEEVRNISRNLHPAVFETIGLEASIENLCERISEVGLFTTCDIEYTQKLPKNKELQLYRIIQEALNNTLKHGKANAAKVILTSEHNSLHLEVKDNGTGFDVNEQLKNPKSFGLQSIIQRAKAITAKININSTNKGTVILLKIPT
jgi:two-component system, NarL family, sensor kinase